MKKVLGAAAVALLCVAGIVFAQTAQKESELEKQIAQIGAKLDSIAGNQAKLDTIIANQETIIQMLKIQRWR